MNAAHEQDDAHLETPSVVNTPARAPGTGNPNLPGGGSAARDR
jgi:hypothetical protein